MAVVVLCMKVVLYIGNYMQVLVKFLKDDIDIIRKRGIIKISKMPKPAHNRIIYASGLTALGFRALAPLYEVFSSLRASV